VNCWVALTKRFAPPGETATEVIVGVGGGGASDPELPPPQPQSAATPRTVILSKETGTRKKECGHELITTLSDLRISMASTRSVKAKVSNPTKTRKHQKQVRWRSEQQKFKLGRIKTKPNVDDLEKT
jgi:hypothetical protein